MRKFIVLFAVIGLILSTQAHASLQLSRGANSAAQVIDRGGGVSYPQVDAIEIEIINASSWALAHEVMIMDGSDVDQFASLTAVNGSPANNFSSITAGQYTTDSDYSGATTNATLKDGSPDISSSSSPVGNVHWSDSAGAGGLTVFVEFTSAFGLKEIYLCVLGGGVYNTDVTDIVFKDESGTVITPISSPANNADYFQTTNTVDRNWYRWTF